MARRDSAIHSCTTPCLAIGAPNVERDMARAHISSSARSAMPRQRMQWWMRPGPEPGLRHHEAAALRAEQVGRRHPHLLEVDDAVAAVRAVVVAEHRRGPLTATPGVSSGTRIIECRAYRAASGSLTPITIDNRHSGRIAPVDHHLRPLTT